MYRGSVTAADVGGRDIGGDTKDNSVKCTVQLAVPFMIGGCTRVGYDNLRNDTARCDTEEEVADERTEAMFRILPTQILTEREG